MPNIDFNQFVGQWLVNFSGQQRGYGLLSADASSPLDGWASLYQEANADKKTAALFLKGRLLLTVGESSWTGIADSAISSVRIELRGTQNGIGRQSGEWVSTDGLSGEFSLTKLIPNQLPQTAVALTWSDLEQWIDARPISRFIFRGIGDSTFDLVSTAHRDGFFDLERYLRVTLPPVAREIARLYGMRFDLENPDSLAEFIALIRHHGFPTPVMDWSKSAWVSAYFAAESAVALQQTGRSPAYFRIYCLKEDAVGNVASFAEALVAPYLLPQVFEIYSAHTNRILAQEGVFMMTPCLDVVVPYLMQAQRNNTVVLDAIDVPVALAEDVLRKLDKMNINASKMTPGIDSTLRDLRRRILQR